jgi:next-to-BRCA1 protein 1
MGSHFIKETTRNTSSPTPSVPYQSHPWPPSEVSNNHTPVWAPAWQVMPPAAPAVVYPSDPYTPVTPFIPPPPGHVNSPWRSFSPVVQHPPPSNVTPYPPSPAQVPVPVPAPIQTPPRPPIHRGILCDMCDKVIEGVRHKCLDCRGMHYKSSDPSQD